MKSHEFSRRALNLSLAIYRVTAKLSEGDVLTGQVRALSNEIAGDLATGELAAVDKKIERLRVYFKIAQAQNWIAPINWSTLDFEYYKLSREVLLGLAAGEERADKKEKPSITSHNIKQTEKIVEAEPSRSNRLSSRQEKVLRVIQDKGSAKMSDLLPLLKNIASERTLRNDLQELVNKKVIRKEGFKKSAKYLKV